MLINLSRAQERFITAKTRGRLFLAGIGSGKTYILCYSAITEALQSRICCIVSFTYRSLRDVVASTMINCLEQMSISYHFNKVDMTFIINNTPILLRSGDAPDRLRGLNLDSCLIDEASYLSRDIFDIMIGRLRRSPNAWWGLVSTPKGRNWLYDIIKQENMLEVFNNKYMSNNDLTVVLQSTLTSPFLPDTYVADLLKQYTTSFARQELDAQIIDNTESIFKFKWFNIEYTQYPNTGVRYWDLAVSTKNDADYSVGLLMNKEEDKYYIQDIKRYKLAYPELKRKIIETAVNDGTDIIIGLEEAGQQQSIIDDIRTNSNLHNHIIRSLRPTKDKISRSYPVASQAERGRIVISDRINIKDFEDECNTFSVANLGKYHDDQIDALNGAYELINRVGSTNVEYFNLGV